MARSWDEELSFAATEDGLVLAGLLLRPAGLPESPVSLIWVHGNAASFHIRPYVAIGRELVARGHRVILGDTRGHDIAAFLDRADGSMSAAGGAAWERLGESPRDVAAWVDLAASACRGPIVLAGHSAGAQKVVLYQAERQDPRVAGLALVSPDIRGFSPPGALDLARQLVAEGRGMETLPAQPYAPSYLQSAQTAVAAADVLARLFRADAGPPLLSTIQCPLLVIFGSRERHGAADLATIRQGASAAVEGRVLPDADHFLTGQESAVADAIAAWAGALG